MNKVLHVLPMNKISGAERLALLICKNLNNYEPLVVCGGQELANVFKKNGIKNYNIKFSNKKLLSNAYQLSRIIKNESINIVHAHDNTASLVSYLAKRIFKLNIKIVSHIHNCYQFLTTNSINKRIDRYLRNKYDLNITCGKIVTDFYKENTDYFKEEKNLTLSNAMDIKYITDVNKRDIEEVIKKYKIPSGKKILGFIGRLDEQKGVIPFIKELSKHKEKFEDSIILLVGNGSQEDEVRKLIKELGLEDLFILIGFKEDIRCFYSIIDIFFLPSLYEGLPMVLLEAMSFKKPVISMNVGSISEVINNNTGILVESKNYYSFINELNKLKSSKILSSLFGENSFKYINKNYNIKTYINKLENIYDNF